MGYKFLTLMCVMACGWAQLVPETTEASTTTTTPVPILRQVNEVNEDGSYTYGFEAADGTFKLETRDLEGNVNGKYGYLDEFGVLKTVEYSARNETGFVPVSDLLPKVVPLPEVPAVPQPQQPIPALPQPVSQPQFVPRPQPAQFVPRPQQAFVQQPQVVPQRPINIALDGFSEDRNEDGFVDGSPEEAAKGNPVVIPATQPQFVPQFIQQTQPQFVPHHVLPQAPVPQRPINVELDGFSEDRNQDGFVDGSPEEAAKGNPSVAAFLPAGTSSLPASQPLQPLPQPQFVPQTPQGFNRFLPNQPQFAPQLTAQQIHQVQQQQIQHQQQLQQLAAQQERLRQLSQVPTFPQQSVPQAFAPQQIAGQRLVPQQFVPQQFRQPHFFPQQFSQFQPTLPVAPPQPKA